MIWIVLIILSITISLYYFIREKIKGHDFRLVNKVRPYMQLLLLLSIELALPCLAYVFYMIINQFTDNGNVLSLIPGFTMGVMIVVIVTMPLKVNNSTSHENDYAIYLRSFRSDSIYGNYFENLLRTLIRCFYPIYEIGNPNEAIKLFKKNITIYRTDDDWQETINDLKSNARIIVVKLDGTEGLGWEIKSIIDYLNKVLFVANDKESFDEFTIMLQSRNLLEYHGFPTPTTYPSIIWKSENNWNCGDQESLEMYISLHPWQEESVDCILNSLVIYSTIAGTNKKYIVHRFPTFLKGNKCIALQTPMKLKIAFLLFPYSQQFWSNHYLNSSMLSWIVNMYFYGSAFAYYLLLFLFAYNIQGGITWDNLGLRMTIISFICMIPIYVLSYFNGIKALRIGNSFLTEKNFQRLVKRNFIKGLILSLLALGSGFYSKHSADVERAQRQALIEKYIPDYEQRKEEMFCRNHIDSIFMDVSSSYFLLNVDKYGGIDGRKIFAMEISFQQAIKDSIGSLCYYPTCRDSLMTDKWYKDIAWKVLHQFDNK